MSIASLTRWSGMVAMLGATLFIIASLIALLFVLFFLDPATQPGQLVISAFYIRSLLALVGETLLVLGLVGLYVRQSQATGVVGIISFLVTFFGQALTLASVSGSTLVETFGWALFGAATLQAGIYPRPAAILLVVGAVATAFISASVGSLGDVGDYVGAGAAIILNVAVAWLGYDLFTGGGDPAVEHPQ